MGAEEGTDIHPETCCEYILYSIIQQVGGVRWSLEHNFMDGRAWAPEPEEYVKAFAELTTQLEEAVDQTVRFGVDAPVRNEEYGSGNESYWTWYRTWNSWVEGLSDDEFDELDDMLRRGLADKIPVLMRAAISQDKDEG